jgi:hypothetical protein
LPSACGTSAGFAGLAGFAGEGLGFANGALPGTGLLSAFLLPNIEKTTRELPGFPKDQGELGLYHFA